MTAGVSMTPQQIAETLGRRLGINLGSVVLHSAGLMEVDPAVPASWRFLVVVERTTPDILDRVRAVFHPGLEQGLKPPRLFTRDSLAKAADVFAVEFLDIKLSHTVLYGPDPLLDLEFSQTRYLFELDHELQELLVTMRQGLLLADRRDAPLLDLLINTVPTAMMLFRGVLRLNEATVPQAPMEMLLALAHKVPLNPGVFALLLALRSGRRSGKEIAAIPLCEEYCMGIAAVAGLVHDAMVAEAMPATPDASTEPAVLSPEPKAPPDAVALPELVVEAPATVEEPAPEPVAVAAPMPDSEPEDATKSEPEPTAGAEFDSVLDPPRDESIADALAAVTPPEDRVEAEPEFVPFGDDEAPAYPAQPDMTDADEDADLPRPTPDASSAPEAADSAPDPFPDEAADPPAPAAADTPAAAPLTPELPGLHRKRSARPKSSAGQQEFLFPC